MRMHLSTLLCLIVLITFGLKAQNINIPLGTWRDHLPMNQGIAMAQTAEKVYAAVDRGLIVLRKSDLSIEALTKAGGLSDISVTAIGYHQPTHTIIVGYRNGNIDFIKDSEISNLSDIKRTSLIAGAKQIYTIKFKGNDAFLCTSFGVVVIDMVQREIKATWYPTEVQTEVLDLDFMGDSVAVATNRGAYIAAVNDPGIVFYGNWQILGSLGTDNTVRTICSFDNAWYATRYIPFESNRDTVFKVQNGIKTIELSGGTYLKIKNSAEKLFICETNRLGYRAASESTYTWIDQYDFFVIPYPIDVEVDNVDSDRFWIADQALGLASVYQFDQRPWFTPEGPYSKNVFRMTYDQGQLWAATGGYDLSHSPLYVIDGILNRDGAFWRSFRFPVGTDFIRDFISVAVDPADSKHVFAATWGYGVYELQDGAIVQRFDTTNSALDGIFSNSSEIRASTVKIDKNANLWTVVTSAEHPVALRKADGTWRSYSFGPAIDDQSTGDMLVDTLGNKWFVLSDQGLVVFSTDENDDLVKFKLVNDQVGRGALNSKRVLSFAQDLEGLMWVGTDKGVNVFYNPDAILQDDNFNWDAQQIIVSQGGFNQYLLNSEEVTSIVVDGANRKWFGTSKAGVFCVSPDGTEQLYHFTFENSPLLSNTVITMCMDYQTGELYIGTDQGISSYRTDATLGAKRFDGAYAFPNPVRPEFNGMITVTGLVANSEVRITDVEGNVVFSDRANGGTITWDGRTYQGVRAASGVYLVFASNDDGSQSVVTKILFVN